MYKSTLEKYSVFEDKIKTMIKIFPLNIYFRRIFLLNHVKNIYKNIYTFE